MQPRQKFWFKKFSIQIWNISIFILNKRYSTKKVYFTKNVAKAMISAALERENLIDDRQRTPFESEKVTISGDGLKI